MSEADPMSHPDDPLRYHNSAINGDSDFPAWISLSVLITDLHFYVEIQHR